jgi:PhzF family phenazine biosynthesis protein
MRRFAFRQVDVFTGEPYKGNPVAVVLEADGLQAEQMQALARWTNLSETTFVCASQHPEADYQLRIFTPRSELPFAGHPTLGSAHAALEHGLVPAGKRRIVQECVRGLVSVEREDDSLFFSLPEPEFRSPADGEPSMLADALGIPESAVGRVDIIDVGPVWWTLHLESVDAVRALRPDMDKLLRVLPVGATGVTVFALSEQPADSDLEVRSFAPAEGVPEDPVCGSGNGCVAAFVRRHGLVRDSRYTAAQGHALGRDGRVAVRFDDDGTICIEGSLRVCPFLTIPGTPGTSDVRRGAVL